VALRSIGVLRSLLQCLAPDGLRRPCRRALSQNWRTAQGQFKLAAEHAAHAAALDPLFVRAHARAGKACLCLGRWEQARGAAPLWEVETPHGWLAAALRPAAGAQLVSSMPRAQAQHKEHTGSAQTGEDSVQARDHCWGSTLTRFGHIPKPSVTGRRGAAQAAGHYARALALDPGNAALRAEAGAVDTVRGHVEQGARAQARRLRVRAPRQQ
jgi:hypothetical protein